MDVLDFINRNGQRTVPNSNYNPKSKKNTEPPTLIVPDIQPFPDEVLEMAKRDAMNQYSINANEAQKYRDFGLNYNPRENLDNTLAEVQSNWSKAKNALLQTVVSEVGVGSIKAFSDIFDAVANVAKDDINDYTNPISQTLEGWQKEIRENIAPIYVQDGVNINNGGFSNFGWWMSNMPSIASSLTLLIPGRAISGGIGKLFNAVNRVSGLGNNTLTRRLARGITRAAGVERTENGLRLNRLGEALNDSRNIKLANEITKDFGTATVMRVAENYQESRQTYQDTYDIAREKLDSMSDEEFTSWYNRHKDEVDEEDFVNNDRETIAKKIANKSADTTFKTDMWNVFFDVAQLWGLRDATKIFKNVNSTKIRADHRKSIEQLGKTSEEVTKLASDASKMSKLGNTLKDVVRGTGKTMLTESTEGIEEMVNYVAQQEGITAGKILLETATPNSFSTRMSGYWHSPELWESAFWGLMGGVVFQGLGSVYNQAQVKRAAKKRQEERKQDAKTKEEVQASKWYELEELPEIKAARAAIGKRNSRTTDMFGKLSRIDDGFNIFAKEDEITHTTPKFEGTEDQVRTAKARAKESVMNEYMADIVADAMHSGTYNTLIDYFSSEQMKQAMVDNNVVTKPEADEFVSAMVDKAEHIKQTYDEQIRHISSQANFINYTNGNKEGKVIPMEYVQMIAKENLDNILVKENLSNQEGIVDREITEITSSPVLQDIIDSSIPYTDIMTLGTISSTYSDLEAQKRKIKNDDSLSDLDKLISISGIERKQKVLLDKLENITNVGGKVSPSIGRVLFTLQAAARASYDNNGRIVYDVATEDFEKTDKELLEQAGYKLTDIELEDAAKLSQSYNENLSVFDNLVKEAKREISDSDVEAKKLKDSSARLYDLYRQKANIELAKDLTDSEINLNRNDIIRRVDEIHNQVSEARKEAIKKAGDIVIDIYDKYKKQNKGNNIKSAVALIIDGKREQAERYLQANFTKDEKEKLIDAFDILNLTSDNNIQLARYINNLISGKDFIDEAEAKEGVDDEIIAGEEITDDVAPVEVVPAESEEEVKEKKVIKPKNRRERKKAMRAQKRAEREAAIRAEEERARAEETPEPISPTGEVTTPIPEVEPIPITEEEPVTEEPEDETPPPAYPLTQLTEELDTAIKDITPDLIQEVRKNVDFDITGAIDTLKKKALDSQREHLTPEQYTELNKILTDKLNDLSNRLKRVQSVLNKKDATLSESAEAVAFASKIGTVGEEKIPDIVVEGIENFINKYLDASLTPIKDGKKVINVKELLDIARKSVNDDSVVDYILDKLKTYLSDETIKDKYYIIDPVTLEKTAAGLNTEEERKAVETQQQDMRINIADYIDFYNDDAVASPEESKKYFEVLDSLKGGDVLDLTVDAYNIYVSKNGVVIGSGAIPRIDGNSFIQGNKGWIEDVALNQGGEIISKALQRYKEIFTAEGPMYDELRSVILDAVRLGTVTDVLAKSLINTQYIQAALDFEPESFVKNGEKVDDYAKAMLEHLVSLYNYATQDITFTDKQSHIEAINNGLENYFYNLYQTYDTVSKIDKSTQVKITYINDGQVITPFTNSEAANHHKDLPFAKDVIADRTTTRLSIYSAIDNIVHVSGHEALANRGLKNTQSVLTLFDRNNQPTFVTIDYLTIDDYNHSKGMQSLLTYAKTEFQNLVERLTENNGSASFSEIEDILRSVIATDERDRISILRGLSGRGAVIDTRPGDYPGYVITNLYFKHPSSEQGSYIRFTRNPKGKIKFKIFDNNTTENYEIDSSNIAKVGAQVFNFILNHASTEVSTYGIESDNNPNMVISKGFIQRRNGKLVTVFGSNVTEYNSYNDFIIDNDLIRVNLSKDKRGSNRTSRGTKQLLNQVMYVQISVESSPVEKIDDSKQIPLANTSSDINQETYNNVLDIFKQDRVSGRDLFIAAIGEERYVEFINEASALNILETILPTSIKYHPNFNYTTEKGHYVGTEAATNTSSSDKFIKVGKADGSGKRTNVRLKPGQVIVGDEFLSELASIKGSNRIRGIAVMIHEKLHDIIANNPDYTKKEILDAIRPICDEFIAGCKTIMENNEKSSNLYIQAEHALKGLAQYDNKRLYKDDSTKLEEFLVETITNSDFIDLMNSIDTTDNQTKGKENIFTKLINLLLKYFFKTDVKKGKLLEKEIKTLSNLISDKQVKKQEEQKSITKEIVTNPATAAVPAKPIVKRIILGKKPVAPARNDDDYADLSNIGIVVNNENNRLDGFLSAIPIQQSLKFAAMRNAGTLKYACKY